MQLKYGRSELSFRPPDAPVVIKSREPMQVPDKNIFFQEMGQCVASLLPISVKPLRFGIAIADKTRLSEYTKYLPWIIDAIAACIDQPYTIQFYIAYGTHPRQTDEESLQAYGPGYLTYEFIHHHSEKSEFKNLGKTTRGTDVNIHQDFLNSDIIMTFGAISHHYFAGFGGGRKLMFPGLGAKESILHNHSLFLNFKERKLDVNCHSGILKGNPVADDLKEIYDLLPPVIGIHSILNSKGEVTQLHVGSDYITFENACRSYESFYKINSEREFDLVVASAGGYPKDINLIQSHKSLHNSASLVKDGGKLVLFAECRDGIGNDGLLNLMKDSGLDVLFSKMESGYENNAGTALSLMKKTRRIQVHLVTSLTDNICHQLGMNKISIKKVQQMLDESNSEVAIVPNASIIYL